MALVLLAACSGTSFHTANEASGDIVRMDDNSITLEGGGTFVIPEERRYLLNDLDTTDSVTVFYEEVDGKKVAQEIMNVK